jgi:SAM-dependent methyltransferase
MLRTKLIYDHRVISLNPLKTLIFPMKKAQQLLFTLSMLLAFSASAQTLIEGGDDKYKPSIGQDGKDVIWVPTGDALVINMLKMAKVGPSDLVYDLGAGDGKIAIAAAKEFGATSVGIEFNPDMAALGQRNAERAGVSKKVKIIQGDIFKEDFSKATVVTMYLLPDLNIKLRPTILKMNPGTRVVSHAFTMGDWEADAEVDSPAKAYFWVVPANVAGEWNLSNFGPRGPVTLSLSQHYQRIGGNLLMDGKSQPILNPKLTGSKLEFGYKDLNNVYRTAQATITGSAMKGDDKGSYIQNEFTGVRR